MNRTITGVTFGVLLGLGLLVCAPAARADAANQAAQFTFNRPVEVSGVALPAGTYWFLVPDNVQTPNVVQIRNADRTQVIATLETIPTTRTTASNDSALTFAEPRNQPPALLSWYYPSRLTGHEFVYSPREESRISESQQLTVTARPAAHVHVG